MKFSKAQLDYIATIISTIQAGVPRGDRLMFGVETMVAEHFARELSKDSPRFPWDRFMARAQGGSEG